MENAIKRVVMFTGLFLLSVNAALAEKIPAGKLFNYAEALFEVQQYGYAFEEYTKIVDLYPDNKYKDDAQFKKGECLYHISSLWFAIEEWQKLIAKYPNSGLIGKAKENIKLANILLQRSELPTVSVDDKVANRFIDIANWARWNCAIPTDSGGYVYDKELKQIALSLYDRITAEFPKSPIAIKAQFLKATLYEEQHKKNDYLTAIAEFQKIADTYPDNYYGDESLKKIGDIYEGNLGKRKEALAAYQQIIDRKKSDPDSYYVSYAEAKIAYYK
jgi:tetratricopeptide (TPR) repeat protein